MSLRLVLFSWWFYIKKITHDRNWFVWSSVSLSFCWHDQLSHIHPSQPCLFFACVGFHHDLIVNVFIYAYALGVSPHLGHQYREGWLTWNFIPSRTHQSVSACDTCLQGLLISYSFNCWLGAMPLPHLYLAPWLTYVLSAQLYSSVCLSACCMPLSWMI